MSGSGNRKTPVVLGLLASGAGIFIILLYAGVIPFQPPARCRALFCAPYHWQILCFGLGFAGMGAALLSTGKESALGRACAYAGAVALAAALAGTWLAY